MSRALAAFTVTHAVLHRLGGGMQDDEPIATAVGILTARILTRIERLGYAI